MAEAGGATAICCLQGDVLEVSAGTGRNLRYYSKAASSVTITDTSKDMLWHARQKRDKCHVPVTFCLADAQRMLPETMTNEVPREASLHSSKVPRADFTYQDKLQTFNPAQFDTVIDTFGLCSHSDPVAALEVGQLSFTGLHNDAHVTVHADHHSPVLQHVPPALLCIRLLDRFLEGSALHHTRPLALRAVGLLSAWHTPD